MGFKEVFSRKPATVNPSNAAHFTGRFGNWFRNVLILTGKDFRFIASLSQSRFSLCKMLEDSNLKFPSGYLSLFTAKRFLLLKFLLFMFTKFSILDFQISSFSRKTKILKISSLNSLMFFIARKFASAHFRCQTAQNTLKFIPVWNKNRSRAKRKSQRSEEFFSQLREKRFFPSFPRSFSLSCLFPKGKFVVGWRVSWVFRGFLRFLRSPTTATLVHCAVDAADFCAW